MFTKIMSLSLVAIAIAIASCGKKSETKSEVATGAFLKMSDFAVTKATDLDKDDVSNAMKTEPAFYNNKPEKEEEAGTDDQSVCLDTLQKTLKVKANKTEVSFSGDLDLGSCFTKSNGSTTAVTYTTSVFKIKIYAYYSCANGDFSAYNDMPFDTLIDKLKSSDVCDKDGARSSLYNTKSEMQLIFKIGEGSYELNDTGYSAQMDANGEACKQTIAAGVVTSDSACYDLEFTNHIKNSAAGKADAKEGTQKLKKVDYPVGFKGKTAKTAYFFEAGTLNVALGAWTGTVTYTDATTEPKWSMKKGTETAEGTVTTPTALHVAKEVTDKINHEVSRLMSLIGN